MPHADFIESLSLPTPPELGPYLVALWYDAKGNWKKSHEIVQDIGSKDAALIHAYLHRKEGDVWNADYWYARANVKRPDIPLQEEWDILVKQFISR